MSALATALITSLRGAGDSLSAAATVAKQAPLACLARLRDLERQPVAAACERAVSHAVACLRREVLDPFAVEALLALLAADSPAAAQFRGLVIEEFLLAGKPNLAPLVDHYRRILRPASQDLPPWRTLAHALSLLFGRLLPEAISAQSRLHGLLPSAADRVYLDRIRVARPADQILDRLIKGVPSQAIVASGGSHIAQVQQTIVHGNLYTYPAPRAADLTALFVRYRAFVIESFGALDFRGIMQMQSAARISLDQIYIPIFARSRNDARTGSAGPLGTPLVLHDYVREQPFLVVLGDPGSGKSTLVRYLITTLARGDAQERLDIATAWLPIFFPVAAFADARGRPGGSDLSPLAYLSEYYIGLSQPDYGPLFARAMAMGHALLLLDGLDEVREDRAGIIRCLEAFVHEWDAQGNRFIATSRIVGYDDTPLDPRLFVSVVIQPLSDAQIAVFVNRWSQAYEALAKPIWPESGDLYHDLVRDASATEQAIRVEQHARSLGAAICADANVAALARTPLLLTILALIHNQGARLPDRRVDLYRLCVEALAETWNRARSLSGRPVDLYLGDERLDERFVVNLLGPVALWIHGDQPGGLVDQDDLEVRIAATLAQTDGLPRGRARRLAQDFIDLMRRDTGLLQERGYRRFGFLHLTFEEYLAARGLLESVTVDNPDTFFHRYSSLPRWHEVLRLAITAAPQREAQRLLLHLLDAPAPRDRAIILAGECLRDIGHNGATQRAWDAVIQALLALTADPTASLDGRISAGTILGHLGDPRRIDPSSGGAIGIQHGVAPYWCPIAPGPFWCGDEGAARRTRAGSLRRVELAQSFLIARFPVTNAEFGDFVAAGGYNERRWWSEAGWPSPNSRPTHGGTAEHGGLSQPVVGVSWYEASAYCAWRSAVGRRAGWLSTKECLRLPTAIEWERAARHTDRRRYPWGDQPPTNARAAFGIAAPVPIGAFPSGAATCGAQDLSGNIWEWTASLAESSESLKPCEDVSPGETPVIKGGGFDSKAEDLRCGASSWRHPGQRSTNLGFRAVRTAVKE